MDLSVVDKDQSIGTRTTRLDKWSPTFLEYDAINTEYNRLFVLHMIQGGLSFQSQAIINCRQPPELCYGFSAGWCEHWCWTHPSPGTVHNQGVALTDIIVYWLLLVFKSIKAVNIFRFDIWQHSTNSKAFVFVTTDVCPAAQSEDGPGGCVCGRARQQEPVQVWAGHRRAEIRVWFHFWHLFPLPHCWGCHPGKSYSVECGRCLFNLCDSKDLVRSKYRSLKL